jgi:hypothetical protein
MATTALTIINQAIQRSALNNPDLVPTAQMLGYITNLERSVYAQGAKYNPDYFGAVADTATRSAFTDSWDLTATPGGVFAVSALKVQTITGSVSGVSEGDDINIIGFRWPELHVAPRAYIRGQSITGYGTDLGAADPNMVTVVEVFYSVLPAAISTVSANVTIPDEWVDLIIVPLARILAIRDHRPEDVAALDAEYNSLMASFIDHVSVYDHAATRPLIAVPAATGPRPPAGGGVQPGAPRIFG